MKADRHNRGQTFTEINFQKTPLANGEFENCSFTNATFQIVLSEFVFAE
jgi:hypothetical protein